MMKTEFYTEYHLFDTSALEDGVENAMGFNQPFANLSLFKTGERPPERMTLEQNFSILDGSMEEMPDNPTEYAYFSNVMSGADGYFETNPQFRVQFSEKHSSVGLTLHFEEVYPDYILIRWYDLSGIEISKKYFSVDSLDYYAENQVEEYGAVEIEFLHTVPFHFVKMYYVQYGHEYVWGMDVIKEASLSEETDIISDKVPINKLSMTFIDANEEFNIGNTTGLHKVFQKKQKMYSYEKIDGNSVLLGIFFLDKNTTTKNLSKLEAVDYKGILDNTDFRDGRVYNGDLAGTVIEEIMATAGITDFQIDNGTYNTKLYGTLKIQTCRKALREVLFACGSIAETSRRTDIYIRKSDRDIKSTIRRARKFSTTLKTDYYISDVTVKYPVYTLAAEFKEVAKGHYTAGVHTIQLSNPAVNITTNIGTITKQMPYYVVLNLPADADVILTGKKWEKEDLAVTSSIIHLKSGESRKEKSFTGTLLNYAQAQKIADSILDYYQLQQIIECKYIGGNETSGNWVEIENPLTQNGNFAAGIESLTTDLTGGFIQTAKCRGYYKLTSNFYFCGDELYTGEDIGIL